MNPCLLRLLISLGTHVLHSIAFATREFSGSELRLFKRCSLIRRNFGRGFCYDPITASARHFLCTNFHQTTTFDGQKMSRLKHFHVDYGLDPVVNIMSVYLAGDDFLTNMMNSPMNVFVDDS